VEPGTDLSAVTRPCTSPLLRPVQTPSGERRVWATFSHGQIDLDFRLPVEDDRHQLHPFGPDPPVLDLLAPGIILITETNVPHRENIGYSGAGDEAHMIYQFSLPSLLLHTLETGESRYLMDWVAGLEPPPPGCIFFNFIASHDGIGVRPRGLLPDAEIEALLERMRQKGGQVSRREHQDGSQTPYELNITYFDTPSAPPDS